MSLRDALRGHPPTAAGAAAALVASVAGDVQPYVEALPVVSPTTATLTVYVAAGLVGGAIGKLAERWTMPWYPPPEGDGPDGPE